MTNRLNGAELMSTGDPDGRGLQFSIDDLHAIADSFRALGLSGRVPLKFGHNDQQPMTDGQPALGWVSRVWVDGGKLLADFVDMPSTVYEAIKKKLYKFVSVELLPNVKAGTRVIPWVLDAVALLGADQPAFGSLRELEALTMRRRPAFRATPRVTLKRQSFSTREGKDMDATEVQAMIDKATGGVTEKFTTQIDQLKKDHAEQLKAKDAELAKERLTNHRREIVEVFNRAIEAKTIEPAVREKFERLTGLNDDARALSVKKEDAELFVKDNAKPVKEKTKLKAGPGDEGDEGEEEGTASEIVFKRANKIVLSRGQKPTDAAAMSSAIQHVLRTDETLSKAYFDAPNDKVEAAA